MYVRGGGYDGVVRWRGEYSAVVNTVRINWAASTVIITFGHETLHKTIKMQKLNNHISGRRLAFCYILPLPALCKCEVS